MSFDGAGNFSRTPGTRIANAGSLVSAQVNDETDNLVNGINGKVNLDGKLAMTGLQTLFADGTAVLHAATVGQLQKEIISKAASVGGTVDVITIVMSPVSTAWATKETFEWISGGANTISTPTINKDGIGAKTIVSSTGAALLAGATGISGVLNRGYYDGTNVRLVSQDATKAGLATANTFTQSQTIDGNVTINNSTNAANNTEQRRVYAYGRSTTGVVTQFTSLINYVWNAVTGSESMGWLFQAKQAGADVNVLTVNGGAGGVLVGAPTGGDQGVGKLNATQLFQNGLGVAPIPTTAATVGQWAMIQSAIGAALFLPATGTFAYLLFQTNSTNNLEQLLVVNVASGGTQLSAPNPGIYFTAAIWRIA